MFDSEFQHLQAFLGYVRNAGLERFIRDHNWAAFASGYNGQNYASNLYDEHMAAAYARHSSHR
jgi:hypothetical protein